MDSYRSFSNDDLADWDSPAADEPCMDRPSMIGTDERRMHMRAYEMWLSLLNGGDYPTVLDLESKALAEFGTHSVVLDFSTDRSNPAIAFLGSALRDKGDPDVGIATVADVPACSLISRLTDHYAEILDNRAPVGFEAEFINLHGKTMLYRGILLPYSSDGSVIDLIHGVITWKEQREPLLSPETVKGATTAFAGPAQPVADIAPDEEKPAPAFIGPARALNELVEDARELAFKARDSEGRSRHALYRALSIAYDVALAAEADRGGFAVLIVVAGILPRARAPMTPVVKLVFGRDYDRKRLTEFSAVLTHARRLCLAAGMVEQWLSGLPGGIKAVVAAERRERRPALKVDRTESARTMLASAPSRAIVDLGEVDGDIMLLVARREPDGKLAILSCPIVERRLVDKALQCFSALSVSRGRAE